MENETLEEALPADAPMLSASEDEEAQDADQAGDELEQSADDQNEEGAAEGEGDAGEFEEIEIDGETYAVPTALKDKFLMHADYTRKTQGLAEDRKSVEQTRQELDQRQEAFEQQVSAQKESLADLAKLSSIDEQIAHYQKVDWAKYSEENPIAAQQHWYRYTSMKDQRHDIAAKISKAEHERASKAQQEFATRREQTEQVLRRDIKDWGPELGRRLEEFAAEQGLTQKQIFDLSTNPGAVKILHKAYQADQLLTEPKPGKRTTTKPAIKPLRTVSQKRTRPPASPVPSDSDSDAEWMKKRTAQLQKRS